ncbi:serine/threonine-protein kinase [Myceligenerans pegani]|uniref:Serine/threonine protein kinase n=1 Tax=Myceligenerans pegani TaxID=2776917 RepID=A0ABR9MWH4_9MICO|nr:serine/threonine-protein kinase [Myceligenerans sp. TRM 65318]MBE1875346.1 serine/threonine protein kinase [Myceligenerans sp. TRM 65318]MBE3017617.1 serine/threonine protein kinase [Myceligenerans sp. TRM 65318]
MSDIVARTTPPQVKPLVAGDPRRLGGYDISGRIGRGGMGAVYLATTADGRPLAIKVIHPERADEREFRVRFRREVAAATRVRSRQTAAVVDFDVDGPTPWLATEYVPGPTLAQVVAEVGALPEPAVRELVAGVARALDAIHAEGLVHRDVKPANILIGPDGPCLLDLGIVADPDGTSLTTTGLQVGTPQYMSPEQALGERVSAATDVWSLGAVAYIAATGRPPFGTGTSTAVGLRVVNERPPLDALPAGLRGLVAACLTKDPATRPTPSAVLASVSQPAGGTDLPMLHAPAPTGTDLPHAATDLRTASAPEPSSGTPDPSPRRRRGLLVGLVTAGVMLIGGGLTASALWLSDDEPPATAGVTPGASAESSGSPSPSPRASGSASPSSSSSSSPSASPTPASETTPVDPGDAGAGEEPAPPLTFTPGTVAIPADVRVGQTITATTSGWSPEPAGRSCTWSIGGAQRENLGECAYTVTIDDVGKPIQVRLTATRDGYERLSQVSDPTRAVPQPQVPEPRCEISFEKHESVDRWSGYCHVDQHPDVSYQWCWYDLTSGSTIGSSECSSREMSYVFSYRREHQLRVKVIATRDQYRGSEFLTTAWVPQW